MWVKTEYTMQFDTHSDSDMQYYYNNREKLLVDGWKEISFTTSCIILRKYQIPVKLELENESNSSN